MGGNPTRVALSSVSPLDSTVMQLWTDWPKIKIVMRREWVQVSRLNKVSLGCPFSLSCLIRCQYWPLLSPLKTPRERGVEWRVSAMLSRAFSRVCLLFRRILSFQNWIFLFWPLITYRIWHDSSLATKTTWKCPDSISTATQSFYIRSKWVQSRDKVMPC